MKDSQNEQTDLEAKAKKGMVFPNGEIKSLDQEQEKHREITTAELVCCVWKQFGTGDALRIEELWFYGREKGWLEEQDQLYAERPIERRNMARIVHEFLRIEYRVPEERDWSAAKKLEDLYHCRACAKHVAQVYIKGLMEAQTDRRFGLLGKVSAAETEKVLEQMRSYIKKTERE